ncbi:MAG: pyridoxamine 5'-phosphate oxidase, partial [Propionibacteriaceae bacterium]|nr:pyridoxamine 5'-phosphate oxidase [Propionibacteriaceae bacterium]
MADPRAEARDRWLAGPLHRADLAADPLVQFRRWQDEVADAGVFEPAAMVLVTSDGEARPSARHVLLRGVDADGFTFFTNYESRKGRELAHNPNATLLFPWAELGRQVIVEGAVARAKRAESEAYFATRERNSQLSAWASQQSRPVHDRATLDARFDEVAAEWEGREVECPPFWGGFHLRPSALEFWQQR